MRAALLLIVLALVIAAPLAAAGATAPATDARFDFLYIEANEGEASAGHVGLAFGDVTFDFGRRDDGLLTLDRSPSREFRYRYAVRGNRTIHRLHVAVTAVTRDLVRDAFERRFAAQQRDLAALAAARRAGDTAGAHAIEREYRYHVVRRNCVSEVFRTIDDALADAPDGVDAASTRLLGGHVGAGVGVTIPHCAAAAVRRTWHVVAVDEIPSYRRYRIDDLSRRGEPWLPLRESNTLTSSIYRRADDDSIFLFFTDGAPVLRPLFGAANTVIDTVASVAGLLLVPIDRGATLLGGLRGLLCSIPEIAFVNIRKGTFTDVTIDDAAPLVDAGD